MTHRSPGTCAARGLGDRSTGSPCAQSCTASAHHDAFPHFPLSKNVYAETARRPFRRERRVWRRAVSPSVVWPDEQCTTPTEGSWRGGWFWRGAARWRPDRRVPRSGQCGENGACKVRDRFTNRQISAANYHNLYTLNATRVIGT